MNNPSQDTHILEDLPVYLAGGMSADERKAFEAHVARCAGCATAMFDAKAMDDSLQSVFAGVSPDSGFEDRLISRLHRKTWHVPLHPMVRRAAVGVAATILVGSAGVFFQHNMDQLERVKSASNLTQIGAAMLMYENPGNDAGLAVQSPAPFVVDRSTVHNAVAKSVNPLVLKGENAYSGATSVDAGAATIFSKKSSNATGPITSRTSLALTGDARVELPQVQPTGSPREYSSYTVRDALFGTQSHSLESAGKLGTFDTVLTPRVSDDSGSSATPASNGTDGKLGAINPTALPVPTVALALTNLTGGKLSTFAPAQLADAKAGEASKEMGSKSNARVDSLPATNSDGPAVSTTPTAAPVPVLAPTATSEQGPAVTPPSSVSPGENEVVSRKIIRQGEVTFEIDSFDSTVMNISKIVAEEAGFVSTTDSDKLANGKVRGTVVVRVPPDHLDTLVLKLRGIGDLKSQKISAQDITKQYTDLESELRAARAMQDRLLEIIKNGKGLVKDLLEAEKQLGVWREKIEQVEGEVRYDNNLVSLSTLSITLMERDIKSAAFSSINEQVSMALETEKVEEAYNMTREAIDNAKGRMIQSELKQYDAGQFGATIRAQLPPDAADAVIGRIRQFDGRLANFQRERSQSNEEGSAAPLDASKVKRENVTLSLTIYNLTNIAPRRTTTLTLAAGSVEDVYAAILAQSNKAGARVVSSDLNRAHPDQSTGSITISSPSDKADVLLAAVRSNGELLGQETTDNPDTQNTTDAKRGLVVQVISMAGVQARQSETLQVASSDVPAAFGAILDALRGTDARIIASQLNQQDPSNKTAMVAFDIARVARPTLDASLDKAGDMISRNITRSQDTTNTLDSKVHVELTLQSADLLPARETTTLGVEVPDVQKSVDDLISAASNLGGREINKDISQDPNGRSIAHVIVEVPQDKAEGLGEQIESWGHRRDKQMTRDPQAPQGKLARSRLEVTLADAASSLGGQETTWDAIRNGLSVSGQGLRWSMQMIVVGLCFVAPWVGAMWIGWRLFQRSRKQRSVTAPSASV